MPPTGPRSALLAPHLSRRTLMMGAGVAAVAVSLSACANDDVEQAPEPDPLAAESARARQDAAAATAAIAANPALADTLSLIAGQRTEHGDALDAEIVRLTPLPSPSGTPRSDTPRSGTPRSDTSGPAPVQPSTDASASVPAPSLVDLAAALAQSSRSAASGARTLSGYRAGLLGSISASCALASSAVSA